MLKEEGSTKWMTDEEHARVRAGAFFAVVISTVAVGSAVVTLPLIYNYVQHLQTHLSNEVDFCKIRARDLQNEIELRSRNTKQSPAGQVRKPRAWMFGQYYGPGAAFTGYKPDSKGSEP